LTSLLLLVDFPQKLDDEVVNQAFIWDVPDHAIDGGCTPIPVSLPSLDGFQGGGY